ncbi:MAG TPA: ATP-binding cassette domain-containing protein [Gaiellaceae bacterium]|nr:ATP-binding cassette domain-containing protein [Gaiellaceae bacterium]
MEAEAHLSCRGIAVEYRSGDYLVRPVDGLDLDVSGGELALLLGASGCGKTTLLSVLAAILRPVGGSARLGPTEITTLTGSALTEYRRHKVGIVFQSFNLIPSLTASENVQVPLRAAGRSGRAARERADALLEQTGLADRRRHRPDDLSGGQKQRVAIARALALDPPLLLADEPTAHLDYIQVESVLELLRSLVADGRIVVVSTHDERMIPLADRVVAMSPHTPAREDQITRVDLTAGQFLFRQGDPGDLIYTVEDGQVEIVRDRADGSEEILGRIAPGDYFGELAPIFGTRRSAGARALSDARVVGLTPVAFRRRVKSHRTQTQHDRPPA